MHKQTIMIEYIRGELVEITPALAVIDCNGIGYGIHISLNTYSAIQGKKSVNCSCCLSPYLVSEEIRLV